MCEFVSLSTQNAFVLISKYFLADVSCFQGLFFCPEAASLLLHNFCIYHISPPGHEVCNWLTWLRLLIIWLILVSGRYIACTKIDNSHSFFSGTFTRVLAVRSSCNLSWRSCAFCWWFSRSDHWGSQLFWVTIVLNYLWWYAVNLWYLKLLISRLKLYARWYSHCACVSAAC